MTGTGKCDSKVYFYLLYLFEPLPIIEKENCSGKAKEEIMK